MMKDKRVEVEMASALDLLRDREADIRGWLSEIGASCHENQHHLDAGTPEREYWHHGYMMAIKDSTLKH